MARSMRGPHAEWFAARGPLLLLPVVWSCITEDNLASCRAWLGGGSGKRVNIDQGTSLIEQRSPKPKQFGQSILGRKRILTLRSVGWRGSSTSGLVMGFCCRLVHWRPTSQIRLGGCLCQTRKGHSTRVGNTRTSWVHGASCMTSCIHWSSWTSLGVRVRPCALMRGSCLRLLYTWAWLSL